MSKLIDKTKEFWSVAKEAFKNWNEREPFNNSIIIAYYTIFSLPGLLVVIIAIAAYFFDKEQVTSQISGQINGMLGTDSGKDIEGIVAKASADKSTVIASILGVATLIFGATGVFFQLQKILNKMWEVKPDPKQKGKQKIFNLIKGRVFSFGLIVVIGFLLMVSLVLSAGLSALSNWMSRFIPEAFMFLFNIADVVISLSIITFLFALMYKYLPDAKIRWKDVWKGALVTAVLFVIAKFALGFYLGKSNPGSAYGAAGSIILIMLWVSYAGMILLYGAEFTQVYANRFGRKISPTPGAVFTDEQDDNGSIVDKKPSKSSVK